MNDLFPSLSSAVLISLQVGVWCTVLGFPVAVGVGWVLARKNFPAKSLLSTCCLVPVVLPPVVTGYLLLQLLGSRSAFGSFLQSVGLSIPFTLAGAVIAALIVGLPFYILGARTAFEAVDSRYEEMSLTMGHSPLRIFLTVTMPLAAPGIAGGAVLAFARSLGEFGATVVLAGNQEGETRTIALAVYSLMESPSGEEAIGYLIWISLGIAFVTLVAYEALIRWQRRRLEV